MFPDRIRQTAEDEDATERLVRLVDEDRKVKADFSRRQRARAVICLVPDAMKERFIAWLGSDESDWNNPPADIRRIADAMRDNIW